MPEDPESCLGVGAPSDTEDSASAAVPPLQPGPDLPYRGYGGWLAFFCIVQIFVVPLFALISGAATLMQSGQISGRYPVLLALVVVELVGDIAVVGFGVYAGITLRRLQRGAVGIAKVYLLTGLVWAVFGLALPYMGGELPLE